MIAAPPPVSPTYWDSPGVRPFTGTRDEAIRRRGIPEPPAQVVCKMRQIEDGEHFDGMTFGRGSVIADVVAETRYWPVGVSTTALDCTYLDSGWEYHLVLPEACGNWTFERFPIAGAAPAWPLAVAWAAGWHPETSGDWINGAGPYSFGGSGWLPAGYGVAIPSDLPADATPTRIIPVATNTSPSTATPSNIACHRNGSNSPDIKLWKNVLIAICGVFFIQALASIALVVMAMRYVYRQAR